MQVITSKDNEIIKKIRKLKEKKYRDETKSYIVEGTRIIEEAISENVKINMIVICEECINNNTIDKKLLYEVAKYNCIYVSEKIFNTLTEVKNPQGILAIIDKEAAQGNVNNNEDIIIILDGIQDPGNLGTILRTIDSANISQVIVSKDTVDVFNSKVIRSTMGAIFRVNIVESENIVKTMQELNKSGFETVVTALDAKNTIYEINYKKKVIIIGNEANGVSQEVQNAANTKIKIPMIGKTESLNVSVATGIIIYEYVKGKLNI